MDLNMGEASLKKLKNGDIIICGYTNCLHIKLVLTDNLPALKMV